MKKFWLIFANEYKRHVLKKSFIFGVLSMPLFLVLIIGISMLSVWLQFNDAPMGYVDANHLLSDAVQVPEKKSKIFPVAQAVPFEDEASAKAALENGSIQTYFILSENYLSTGEVTMVKNSKTGTNASSDFGDFLVYNLVSDLPDQTAFRLSEGNNLIVRSLEGTRETGADNWMAIILPVLAGVLFLIAVNISGNYLLQAVVEEKENRTMEILVTSVSPTQLMAGKVVGNMLVGLTQLVVWVVFAVIAIKVAPSFIPDLQIPSIETSYLLLMVATLIPSFVMVAAAMGAIGATATESREAQQIASWFTIPIMIPLWFISSIMLKPNGALSVGMSLFPLTAPIALPLRAVFTDIPAWQIIMTLGLLSILAIFSVWLSGRIFRLGMLRYGKRVRLSEAFRRAK
jgi:ABC-2 type transport system permease protein